MKITRIPTTLISLASFLVAASLHAEDPKGEAKGEAKYYVAPSENPDDVYFGDTHIHSSP